MKPATKALLVWRRMGTTNWAGPISTVSSSAFGVSASALSAGTIAHFRAILTAVVRTHYFNRWEKSVDKKGSLV